MKVLITGGCGFLGSNLAVGALERGDELLLFDNLYRSGSQENLAWLQNKESFTFVHGDIRNANDIAQVTKSFKPDLIFHLAGQVAMTTSIANPRMDFEVNVIGSHNLLEAVRIYAPMATVVYSSTNKVYGDLNQFTYRENKTRFECIEKTNGFDESTPLEFHSPYGCSKGAADQYMLDYARIFDLKTVVFRHSSMYGGRQFATYDQGWVGWFCQKAIETKNGTIDVPFTVSGSGKQVRDVLHADDMKRLYFAAHANIDRARGHAFNIGGGMMNSLSLLELFSLLEEITGTNLNYAKIPVRESDQKVFVADITKAKDILGWKPEVVSSDGISQMVQWITSEYRL